MPMRDSSSLGAYGEAWRPEAEGKRLSLERIEDAARCIDPLFLGSPQYEAGVLGQHSVHRVPETTALLASALALESCDSSPPALPPRLAREA